MTINEKRERFLTALRACYQVQIAAQVSGVCLKTMYRQRSTNGTFANQWATARRVAKRKLAKDAKEALA